MFYCNILYLLPMNIRFLYKRSFYICHHKLFLTDFAYIPYKYIYKNYHIDFPDRTNSFRKDIVSNCLYWRLPYNPTPDNLLSRNRRHNTLFRKELLTRLYLIKLFFSSLFSFLIKIARQVVKNFQYFYPMLLNVNMLLSTFLMLNTP